MKIGFEKKPESAFNEPVKPEGEFREPYSLNVRVEKFLQSGFTPEEMARILATGFDVFTTKNGDGTFTHEARTPDPEWPGEVTK